MKAAHCDCQCQPVEWGAIYWSVLRWGISNRKIAFLISANIGRLPPVLAHRANAGMGVHGIYQWTSPSKPNASVPVQTQHLCSAHSASTSRKIAASPGRKKCERPQTPHFHQAPPPMLWCHGSGDLRIFESPPQSSIEGAPAIVRHLTHRVNRSHLFVRGC